MCVILRFLCLFPIISSCAAISIPTPSSGTTNTSFEPPTSLSTLPNLPDDDFHVLASWYRTVLSEPACIMVCITAMRELALLHFEDADIPQKTWTHPRFPEVELTVSPTSGEERLTVRFAMWLIAAVTRYMMGENKFRSSSFSGLYHGSRVGNAAFWPATAHAVESNSSIAQQPHTSGTLAAERNLNGLGFDFDRVSSGTDLSVGRDQLRAEVSYLGTSINRRDLLMMIIWLLLWLAPRNGDALGVWRAVQPLLTSEVIVLWNRAKQDRYVITDGDLISFLAYLPEILLKEDKFQEMDIVIHDGGVTVARGSFRVKPLTALLGSPPATNITTS